MAKWLQKVPVPIGLLAILCLPACWPMLVLQRPSAIDGTLHLLRLVLLDDHLRQGTFCPRWMPELVYGYGYPLLHFYGPASYYGAEFFHLLGLGHAVALCATFVLLILLAGCGMYLFAFDLLAAETALGRQLGALVAAVAYVYAPYFMVNVYMRGALGEVSAQMLLPWIFWLFRRLQLSHQAGRYVLPASLTLALLATSHTITLIFAPPLLAIYILCMFCFAPLPAAKRRRRFGLALFACLLGAGLSAFYWLPVLLDRGNLSTFAFDIGKQWVADASWTWRTFLDLSFRFNYRVGHPYRLGFVQLLLAMIGVLGWKRRSWEWLFWTTSTLLIGFFMSQLFLFAWENWTVLQVAQFPYRLQTLLCLPLALFAAQIVTRVAAVRWQWLIAALLCIVIVAANRVSVAQVPTLALDDPNKDLDSSVVAQFELDSNGLGTSWVREFLPKWAVDPRQIVNDENSPAPFGPTELALTSGSSLQLQGVISVSQPLALRFTTYYFPGWQASLNQQPVAIFTDPATGVITLDVPAGISDFQLWWHGTPSQQWGDLTTLASLVLLILYTLFLWRRQPGWWGAWLVFLPIGVLLVGGWRYSQPLLNYPLQPPTQSLAGAPFQLLGYRSEVRQQNKLHIYPYWFVQSAQPALRAVWSLVDAQGKTLSQNESDPIYNTLESSHFPVGAIVDDAYLLMLPPGLAAGEYELRLQLRQRRWQGTDLSPVVTVGKLNLPAIAGLPALPPGFQAAKLHFDGNIGTAGYLITAQSSQPQHPQLITLGEAERLKISLYWQADGAISVNYHSFLHLLNSQDQAVAKLDKLPGAIADYPRSWSTNYPILDPYELQIPANLPSGLYTPVFGTYDFSNPANRSNVSDDEGNPLGDQVRLPAIKVINQPQTRLNHATAIKLADLGSLLGYSLDPADTALRRGQLFTVTLFYNAQQMGKQDFTRFLQLHEPSLGMAAQQDSMPQAGANPTSSWLTNEVIADVVPLQIATAAKSGQYNLLFGLYDQSGMRLPLYDADAVAIVDNAAVLATIEVK